MEGMTKLPKGFPQFDAYFRVRDTYVMYRSGKLVAVLSRRLFNAFMTVCKQDEEREAACP